MGSVARKLGRKFTYEDYKTWPDEERWEIIRGEAYDMTPAPTIKHQQITRNLTAFFANALKGKPCVPFAAPTDVVLDNFNVVQPDVLVVCDKNKITEANIQGAPDLVVEVLSPATSLKDRREKKALYERFGVREYLVVHPGDETVDRYHLVDGRFDSPDLFNWDETLPLHTFPELTINLWEIFEKELPKKETTEG